MVGYIKWLPALFILMPIKTPWHYYSLGLSIVEMSIRVPLPDFIQQWFKLVFQCTETKSFVPI